MSHPSDPTGLEIAIIGMAGRFPGAPDLETFWRNLLDGVESVRRFSEEELIALGVAPELARHPDYVRAAAALDGVEDFDAGFFGFNPREAEVIDPQQRLFLESAWEALEDAGYDPGTSGDSIGVYAGAGFNTYLLLNIMANQDYARAAGQMQVLIGNDKDYLASRTAFKLGLSGPSVTVQTACSTSLVALHLACQGLLAGDCDMALAGGISIALPQQGYLYRKGGIDSPDGHCRAFDARGEGTIFGSGVGVVVLKRLADAQADGDTIRAVVKGTAINNDGSNKVGFTAPGVDGQADVIGDAQEMAGVEPDTISYVEAHGTGTPLGDPIEIEALTQVFRKRTARKGFCAIGSVKTNIGHLDTAAGVAGLIKTVLALERGVIPPSLHFEQANPEIDFAGSPFYVNVEATPWTGGGGAPRRAGVSSFGIGGANAHTVLEEAPAKVPGSASRPRQLLLLSARSADALRRAAANLSSHLKEHGGGDLADVAHTLHTGRHPFDHRLMLVCSDADDAVRTLEGNDPKRLSTHGATPVERPVTFLFPGQGAQAVGMTAELYASEATFRQRVDACAELLEPELSFDLKDVLYPPEGENPETSERLAQTAVAQPALFVVEYALAELWAEWGIRPQAMVGHSLGEYVAACLAGVFTLEEALALVAARGRLMQAVPAGAMLAVALPEKEVNPHLTTELSLAAVNGPATCVVSGVEESITAFDEKLRGQGVKTRRLETSHAFHSASMDGILGPFAEHLKRIELKSPKIPYLSNLTGTWIRPEEATRASYWVRHLRQTVRFGRALEELLKEPRRVFLEVGPGHTLSSLVRRHPDRDPRAHVAIPSLSRAGNDASELTSLLTAAGRLWLLGIELDGEGFYRHERRRRIPLPTYPFERQRYWIEGRSPTAGDLRSRSATGLTASPNASEPRTAEPEAVDAVAAAAHERPLLSTAYAAPRNATEQTLAEIWQEALGIRRIGIHDDFLELGGHSLLATEIIDRLRQVLAVDLPLRSLFETPTLASLAEVVDEQRAGRGEGTGEAAELPVLTPAPGQRWEPFPLTEVQEAYWIGRQGDFELGNVGTYYYFEAETERLDVGRFEAAWRRVIDRHEMLRAVFLADGRQQILATVPPYEIEVVDLRDRSGADASAALAAIREEMSHQVLPSDRWPLFEIRVSLLPNGRSRLHVGFDFLIGDAWSTVLLSREVLRGYLDGEVLAPLEVSFRDYVLAERALKGTELYRRSLEYWRRRLPELPPAPRLPLAVQPSTVGKPRFVRHSGRLQAEHWSRLLELARASGLTPSGMLLAAYAEVLTVWSESPRLTLNLTLFNRLPLHPQIGEVVGDFTSLTLVPVDNTVREPFADRARRIQERLWENLDHRYVGGVQVQRELARSRGGGGGANMPVVFTSTLNLDLPREAGSPPADLAGGWSLPEVVYSVSQTPQVWLDHQVGEVDGGLAFSWDAVEELFPPGLVGEMFTTYCDLLRRLAEDPAVWRQTAPVTVPAPQLAARAAVNDTAAPVPEAGLHTLFAEQAARRPADPAVTSAARRLTYGELERRARSLGERLRSMGARPGTLVAVVMEKGWEQVVATLGILYSGAAYLPVDAASPARRLCYLLETGEVEVALTQPWLLDRLEWPESVQCLAVDEREPEDGEALPAAPVPQPDDLAYVIFTSGSTGRPKGVMIGHGGACNTLADVNRRFAVGSRDRVLALSSLSFDLSVYDLFGTLAAGGTVVLPEASAARDPARWLELLARERVTIWNTVPALMEMLVEYAAGSSAKLTESLRLVLLSGDWIPLSLPRRIRELHPEPESLEVVSLGGATEASIWSILFPIGELDPSWKSIPYGKPMANQSFQVLSPTLEPAPVWVPGELHIGGAGLAEGYWRDAERTRRRFVTWPRTGERLYRTGDLGRYLPDGNIEFLGRTDFQVKLRGHRIELGEIESTLDRHPAIRQSVAVLRREEGGQPYLAVYYLPDPGAAERSFEDVDASAPVRESELRTFLSEHLPSYMVPQTFVPLNALPLSANGKVDRQALPRPERLQAPACAAPATHLEHAIAELWQEVLGLDRVGVEENFFEIGGDSLLMLRFHSRLKEKLAREVPVVELFQFPTVGSLARHLASQSPARSLAELSSQRAAVRHKLRGRPAQVAVIGMACRFPGARDIDQFWQNLRDGVESIAFFTDEELLEAGIPAEALEDPNYVKAKGALEDIEWFDASFFNINPKEAELMDPQHRLFLECAWKGLENAGYYSGRVGVYAGSSWSDYLRNLYMNADVLRSVGDFPIRTGNDKDYLPSRVSYKFNLTGPSVNVQTACSTSLVAFHQACQGLLNGECDIALAGGVSLNLPSKKGYLYSEGMIFSPDGHCRSFDSRAEGTVYGEGVGVVVAKRLDDALADGDTIRAVVKGSAVNNDGAMKVGYTAPGVDGQAEVISDALAIAGVEPETITYVEAHGTATPLGDPIEVEALTKAFRTGTPKRGGCALGSVKSNVGHLDAAAGVAGLIKTVLALEHRAIPPSLHFEHPNPKIDFAGSPFYVNAELRPWRSNGTPRRAGVSSFGVGGNNAHVVLEEAPPVEPAAPSPGDARDQLVVVSARTESALERATERLAEHLRSHPELELADVAYTLQAGRRAFERRLALVCRDGAEAADALENRRPPRVASGVCEGGERPVAFLFPGQGTQYVGMGGELYQSRPAFRREVDRCAELLQAHLGLDLRQVLYPGPQEEAEAEERLRQTAIAQPALFVVQYALARLWGEWGVRPQAMIGHSIGEYVAACLAGVFSLEDALALVAARARLMQGQPGGAMLGVALPAAEVEPLLGEELSLAAVNAPERCVLAGPPAAVEEAARELRQKGIATRRLATSHAFHSRLIEGALDPFAEEMRKVRLQPPAIPFVSNVTGTWIRHQEATDPDYWVRHMRRTVRFADGAREILEGSESVLLEVGPGQTLARLVRPQASGRVVLSSLPGGREKGGDGAGMLAAAGRLFLAGVELDWQGLHDRRRRRRLPLPSYPFERQRYWIEAGPPGAFAAGSAAAHQKSEIAKWFYLPFWKPAPRLPEAADEAREPRCWLLFGDEGLGARWARRLRAGGHRGVLVSPGEGFARLEEDEYVIDPRCPQDYETLVRALDEQGRLPDTVVHLWGMTAPADGEAETERLRHFDRLQGNGFYSGLFLAQAITHHAVGRRLEIAVLTTFMQSVHGEAAEPGKATLLALCNVLPQEYPNISCRGIDFDLALRAGSEDDRRFDVLWEELWARSPEHVVAYRGGRRWVREFAPARLESTPAAPPALRQGGVYLITGGLGRIGLVLGEYLARTARAKLVLTGRSPFPARERWHDWLETHDAQNEVSRKILRLEACEAAGGEVLTARADAAAAGEMRELLARIRERFGPVNGVFHLAGSTDEGYLKAVGDTTPEDCETQFRPKVHALLALDEIFQEGAAGEELDFCLLYSSLSTILGGLGLLAYSAANLFMDAFARERSRAHGVPWISVSWDTWIPPEEAEHLDSVELRTAISAAEGIEALARILNLAREDQVVVTTTDLEAQVERWIRGKSGAARAPGDNAAASLHPRPEVATPYAEPENDAERSVARCWQEVLGIEQVGRDDDFFELGGDSLLATQLVAVLRLTFGRDLSLASFLQSPTVAGLAEAFTRPRDEPPDPELEDLADVLREVEGLSVEEVEAQIAEREGETVRD